ncbi:MAG: ABC transporter substrate-binding protein [Oscillospiraceae bacterium]|nr:ABC transporter substrate-binding protein [Oscillospiraceae bacterium]
MKKLTALLIALAMAVSMTACSSAPSSQAEPDTEADMLKIGILQQLEHGSLDAARQGFVDALADGGYIEGENLEIDYQNAQGDPSNLATMSERFVNNKVDMVLAVATGAAQSIASKTSDIPVLFTAVTDPVDAGLVNSNENPGGNISGTNDMNPIEAQIDLITEIYPDTQTIGIVYCSGEDNSILQASIAKAYIESKGLKWVEGTVTNSNDVQQVTQSIVTKCDAIYIPTDNAYASAMAVVAGVVQESKTPVVAGAIDMVRDGGLMTLGLNYYNLGYQTGEMALRILNEGADISTMPVESLVKYDYYFNGEMAQALGLEIPEEYEEYIQ